jgi:hypothetical protein
MSSSSSSSSCRVVVVVVVFVVVRSRHRRRRSRSHRRRRLRHSSIWSFTDFLKSHVFKLLRPVARPRSLTVPNQAQYLTTLAPHSDSCCDPIPRMPMSVNSSTVTIAPFAVRNLDTWAGNPRTPITPYCLWSKSMHTATQWPPEMLYGIKSCPLHDIGVFSLAAP